MSRLFRRGELTAAVLEVVARDEPVHGYGVLSALTEALGRWWRPSPGSVYPTLIALEDAGLIEARTEARPEAAGTGEARSYRLTAAGRAAVGEGRGVLERVQTRAAGHPPAPTLGRIVDRFAAELPGRSTRLDDVAVVAVEQILDRTRHQLDELVGSVASAATATSTSVAASVADRRSPTTEADR